ncbi:hypothetical protein BT96DRAFT_1021543 [Gymnopus androsaceus JB14]|uniref:Uncharacterized protein n=1 Tax=Gymnopus androsaceus JB14 TaxID=1447944 RepID=A0A6A4HCR4_9AGAR|nr:hypothetical protein BT96DRAFT_1021543 [Gymnopus androsaceus JB14]
MLSGDLIRILRSRNFCSIVLRNAESGPKDLVEAIPRSISNYLHRISVLQELPEKSRIGSALDFVLDTLSPDELLDTAQSIAQVDLGATACRACDTFRGRLFSYHRVAAVSHAEPALERIRLHTLADVPNAWVLTESHRLDYLFLSHFRLWKKPWLSPTSVLTGSRDISLPASISPCYNCLWTAKPETSIKYFILQLSPSLPSHLIQFATTNSSTVSSPSSPSSRPSPTRSLATCAQHLRPFADGFRADASVKTQTSTVFDVYSMVLLVSSTYLHRACRLPVPSSRCWVACAGLRSRRFPVWDPSRAQHPENRAFYLAPKATAFQTADTNALYALFENSKSTQGDATANGRNIDGIVSVIVMLVVPHRTLASSTRAETEASPLAISSEYLGLATTQ